MKTVEQLIEKISAEVNIRFTGYKPITIKRIMGNRISGLNDPGIDSIEKYISFVENNRTEYSKLIQSLTINVSSFFRDSYVFETIQARILPVLLKKKNLRIWSAGCAGGEEPYSIAILLRELLKKKIEEYQIDIFASDVDTQALEKAQNGCYNRETLSGTKLSIIDTYFTEIEDRFQLNTQLLPRVQFSVHDTASDSRPMPPESIFGDFDLVLCRNLLIYFADGLYEKAMNNIYQSLKKGGFLVLGLSEALSPNTASQYREIHPDLRIYSKV
ncbi:MAG: protein-glutamate O-methyltransferase CheR [bacterium]|nr:protein-glutamate O-methyltransferase CheR [bacterium]